MKLNDLTLRDIVTDTSISAFLPSDYHYAPSNIYSGKRQPGGKDKERRVKETVRRGHSL
jgi:hypothetical protein